MPLLLPVSTAMSTAALQVVSQLNTFLVAAFETTASAIACCIYFIAQHPEVQTALLQEVDAFGRSGKVEYRDLDKVRGAASRFMHVRVKQLTYLYCVDVVLVHLSSCTGK
jgi:cytochrome P450